MAVRYRHSTSSDSGFGGSVVGEEDSVAKQISESMFSAVYEDEIESSDDSAATDDVDYETRESTAIRNVYPQLAERISHQLPTVSSHLYSCGLIENELKNEVVETTGKCNSMKADYLVTVVQTKLKTSPNKFGCFIKVLEECDIQDIAEKVKECYESDSQEPQVEKRTVKLNGEWHSYMDITRRQLDTRVSVLESEIKWLVMVVIVLLAISLVNLCNALT